MYSSFVLLHKACLNRRLIFLLAKYESLVASSDGQSVTAPSVDKKGPSKSEPRRAVKSVETALGEEHVSFTRKLTLEPGFTYNRYDRSQVVLSGFLALDAIFLGNIAVQGVASDTIRYDMSARYGVSARLNLNLTVPFSQRTTTYQKGGAGGSSAIIGEADISSSPTLGDVAFGFSYRLAQEKTGRPDTVWSMGFNAPTGKHPYGVKTTTIDLAGEDNQLEVPSDVPTGSGVWGVNTGLSFVKSYDPAILFANLGYTYTHPGSNSHTPFNNNFLKGK